MCLPILQNITFRQHTANYDPATADPLLTDILALMTQLGAKLLPPCCGSESEGEGLEERVHCGDEDWEALKLDELLILINLI